MPPGYKGRGSLCATLFVVSFMLAAAVASAQSRIDEVAPLSPEQDATITQMFEVGAAFMTWLGDRPARLDQMSFTPQGFLIDLSNFGGTWSAAELAAFLVPDYIDEVPEVDGWGNPYDYYVLGFPRIWPSFAIRSSGADGQSESETYIRESYPPEEEHRDLLWLQDNFAVWPFTV